MEIKPLSQYFESNNNNIYLMSRKDFTGHGYIIASSCSSKVNEKSDTIEKIVSGLNHFLYYVEHIVGDSEYRQLSIVMTELLTKRIKSTNPEYHISVANRTNAYKELTKFSPEFLDLIVRYTIYSTVYNSVTDSSQVTINKPEAMVLSMLAVLLKFTYLVNKMLNVGSFTDTMPIVYDSLLKQITNAYKTHLYIKVSVFQNGCDIDRRDHKYLQTRDVIEGILSFCQSISEREWISGNINVLRNKFDEVGESTENVVDLVTMALISALKKHSVIMKDVEVEERLFPDPEEREFSKKLSYNHRIHQWSDFACVTLNLVKYVQKTLGNNTKNTARRKIQTVVSSVGLSVADDATSFKNEIYYEANFTEKVKQKRKTIQDIMNTSIDYINKNNLKKELVAISDRPQHIFHKMLYKHILVAVYNERDMVSDLTSKYSSIPITVLLDIFKKKNLFPTISKIINSTKTMNIKYSADDLQRMFLEDSSISKHGDYALTALKDCFSTYIDDSGLEMVLTYGEFEEFRKYAHDVDGLVKDWYNYVFEYDYGKVIK